MSKKAFRCKNIYTALSADLIDGYVITEGNRIIFVGDEVGGQKLIDENTEVMDYTDNFVMPGFNDFHVHLMSGALMERDGVLRYADTEEEAARMLWEKNKDRKGNDWILGGAWDHFRWPDAKLPSKESLDQYFKDTPVFLLNKECHAAWANSEAFRRFNITKDTPDPQHGYFSRTEGGEPAGYIHEAACIPMLVKIFQDMSCETMAEYTKFFAETANSYGITSVGDLPLYGVRTEAAYKLLQDRGELSVRINFALALMVDLEEILDVKAKYASDMLKFIGVKDFLDGTPMGHSGYMLEPYTDMPDFRGEPMIDPDVLKERVKLMAENGIKVRLHACGDGAVRLGLDAFEYAQGKVGSKDLRNCIEHIEATTPEDIVRFGKLPVIPSIQSDHLPKYNFYGHPFHTMIGEERMKYSWPFNSLDKTGAVLALGTDFPVTELNPLRGIFRAVTRLTDDGQPEGGFNPCEKLSVHESLKAYTYGSAYAAGSDDKLGTLEAGKLADIAVFEKNIFECAADRKEMFDMKTLLTVVDGNVVYRR